MNKVSFATVLVSLTFFGFGQEVKAQGFQVAPDLEKVRPYKHKRTVYIEDNSPFVVDRRRPKEAPTQYLIQVPNLPESSPKTVIIKASPERQGGFITSDGTPPPAGFRSNMNSLHRPSGLPETKSGGVPVQSSKKYVKGKMKKGPGLLIKPKSQEKALRYKDDYKPSGISKGYHAKVKTKVKGKRVKKFERGSMLN